MVKHTPLVSQYLEKISRSALEKHQAIIRKYMWPNGTESMPYIAGTGFITWGWRAISESDSAIIYVIDTASHGTASVCI